MIGTHTIFVPISQRSRKNFAKNSFGFSLNFMIWNKPPVSIEPPCLFEAENSPPPPPPPAKA